MILFRYLCLVSLFSNQLLLLFVQMEKGWPVARVLITLAEAHALGGVAGVRACQRPLLERDGPVDIQEYLIHFCLYHGPKYD